MPATPDNGTAKSNVLSAVLSNGDAWVKLFTIALILVTGGSNFIETKSGNELNQREIERAIEEVHQLYPKLNEAVERQKQILALLQEHKQ